MKARDGKILVVGSDSLVGQALLAHLRQAGLDAVGTTRRAERVGPANLFLDLARPQEWRCPEEVDAAIVCAAVNSLEACAGSPRETWQVNVQGTMEVIRQLLASETYVAFLSSSAVFDGSRPYYGPADPVSPHTEFGRQKTEVEKQVLIHRRRAAVIRLTRVIAPWTPMLRNWIATLAQGKPVHPLRDEVMAPLPLAYVATVLARIIRCRSTGIHHVGGMKDITYPEACSYLAARLGADQSLVQPVTTQEGSWVSPLFKNTTLDSRRLRTELSFEIPSVWTSLDTVLAFEKMNAGTRHREAA